MTRSISHEEALVNPLEVLTHPIHSAYFREVAGIIMWAFSTNFLSARKLFHLYIR